MTRLLGCVASAAVIMVCGVVMSVKAGEIVGDPTIEVDADGHLHISSGGSSSDSRIYLNGVDVLGELAELRAEYGQDSAASTPSATTPPASTTPFSPTDPPVVYDQSVGCNFIDVPTNVTHIKGSVDLNTCTSLQASDLQVFQRLVRIDEDLRIAQNGALAHLDAFGRLTTVGGSLYIQANKALMDIDGLGMLKAIGGDLFIFVGWDVRPGSGNSRLASLGGLHQLSTLNGYLSIYENKALTTIDGLSNVTHIGGNLHINV
ncbi:uncharacterized protein MONBRDRAFT_30316 [Monosiga brevicollis MX1]|uniref:Receptor L-domain domain-containing protein n=1 Tax=Monosiga brevicollis TaxID=81824 RepID=A9VDM2_MONBE|nr:uncharacterized protein MONBRDRAFT_30316 [Monosiga brevicollis MX1]EDQ84418.1 predicted protein [Monosiga brevicollis MX1]|eukprot:XP_001750819.1 hypothetical protein [Monosiga brevicollis MX1]